MKKKKSLKIFLYICAIIWAIVSLAPLVFSVISSFKSTNEIYGQAFALPKSWEFTNYINAMEKANIGRAVANSFFLAITSTLLVILLASLVSFAITRTKYRFKNITLLYFLMGLTIPMHTTLIPLADLINRYNLRNKFIPLIFLYATFNLPFTIFIITGYMKGISKEIDEAATIDGCGPLRLLFQVLFPLCKPAAATAAIVTFLGVYNELIFALLFLTDKSKHTISVSLMSLTGRYSSDKGAIFAAICMFILPIIIIYVLCQEHVEKGITAGATKG
ncbi:carbohydrate ABC transporter permease [Clostridium fallax]|uniref:Carbohydrate ABC transporter membrane protein 2, CUT1 family n=1 Tax=Clostridium fallax TaxID=1533 RepID=A0A1M4XDD6_9CLOT|nr:carbohydrate ABC transporter permease [Clostridium fallax]SHE91534.1 carbohydrate ABC transporter membrane protein 2, CUT1 family [Clostridium fallax]SQB05966.1 ABC transporter permease [Clostridium fallax]